MSQELERINAIRNEIKTIIDLAYKKSQCPSEHKDGKTNIGSVKKMHDTPYFKARKELTDYLEQLTYEQVQTVQTIMYIGRDIEEEYRNLSEEEIFKEYFNRLTWNDKKSIEINQIAEKAQLVEYLIEGCKLLKIDIQK